MLHDAKLRAQLAFVHARLSNDPNCAVASAVRLINTCTKYEDKADSRKQLEYVFKKFDTAIDQLLFCGYIVTETEGA